MNTNCLVKKLKGVVDNDNLPKYGGLLWRVPSDVVVNMVISSGAFKNCTIEVTGGLSVWDFRETTNLGQTYHYESQTPEDVTSIRVKGSGGDIRFTDKYSVWDNPRNFMVIYDTVYDNDIKSLKYWFRGTSITINIFGEKSADRRTYAERSGTLNDLIGIGVPFTSIDVSCCNNITGDIAVIAAFKDTLTTFYGYATPLSGSIEDLGECTLLNNLNLDNSRGVSKIGGTVEGFVARQRAAGRTTAELQTSAIRHTNITFNGHIVTGSPGNLSWTANTITCYGETIDA